MYTFGGIWQLCICRTSSSDPRMPKFRNRELNNFPRVVSPRGTWFIYNFFFGRHAVWGRKKVGRQTAEYKIWPYRRICAVISETFCAVGSDLTFNFTFVPFITQLLRENYITVLKEPNCLWNFTYSQIKLQYNTHCRHDPKAFLIEGIMGKEIALGSNPCM